MGSPFDDFNRVVENLDGIEDTAKEEPTLTDEQAKTPYVIIVPGLGQNQVLEITGKDILELSRTITANENINNNRIINRLHDFIQTSEIGEYCWLGHMQPTIMRIKPKDKVKTILMGM